MENLLHFYFLISIILSILFFVLGNTKSLSPLNSTYIMQARERFMSIDPFKLQDPPMSSYSFTIYHRDVFEKSNFNDYDSLLESTIARSQARAGHLASILESKNGANANISTKQDAQGSTMRVLVPKSTDTHFANGEYVASFFRGSQMIKNYLLIDTGSDLVWWQCGPCEANKCYKQNQPLYDSTTSKTFRKVNCYRRGSDCMTNDPAFYCDLGSFECIYDVEYQDRSITKGFMADDVITFVLDQRPIRVIFGCSKNQVTGEKNFTASSSGIVGLGRDAFSVAGYSLPSQFRANLMSMCLSSFYSGKGSILSFHISKLPRATSAKLLPNYRYPSFYFVNLYKIFINDKEVQVNPSWWNFKPDMMGGILVDTGTTFTYFPHDFYVIFRYIFRAEVRDIPMVENPVGPFDTCYKEDPIGRDLYFPAVKLYFGSVNSSTMLFLAQERVVVNYRGLYCLAFSGWNRDQSVLGMYQLQGVGLTFDTSENTLSFDIDACD